MDLYHLYHLHHVNYTVVVTAIILIITISLYLIKNILVCAQFCRFIIKLCRYELPANRNQNIKISDTLESNQAQSQRQRRNCSQSLTSVVACDPISSYPVLSLDLPSGSSHTSPLLSRTTLPVVFSITAHRANQHQERGNPNSDLTNEQPAVEKVTQIV